MSLTKVNGEMIDDASIPKEKLVEPADMAKADYDSDNDGKVNVAELADAVPWSGITDKPTEFPSDEGVVDIDNPGRFSNFTGGANLQETLDAIDDAIGTVGGPHTHVLADITDAGNLAALDTVGTSQIDADAVTFAKIQNIATDKVLGRDTAGSGDIEELGVGAGLSITGGNLVCTVSGSGVAQLFTASGVTQLYNSTTPTNLDPGAGIGSRTLSLGYFAVLGRVVRVRFGGVLQTDTTPPIQTITIRIGTVDIATVAVPLSPSSTNKFHGEIDIVSSAIGGVGGTVDLFASGFLEITGKVFDLGTGGTLINHSVLSAQDLHFRITNGAAEALCGCKLYHLSMEGIN